MPVIGFISSDGTSDSPEGGGKCSFALALRLAESGDSEAFPYPYPLLKGIIDSLQDRDYISVTTILHCLRAAYLKRTEQYYISVEQAYPMFRGTLFHALLEKNPNPNGRIEEKVSRVHRGVELFGTFDSVVLGQDADGTFIIQDWKTVDELPRYDTPYTSHIQQVNLYRWLLGLNPEEVIMEVWYFSMKGVKRCRLKDGKQKKRGNYTPVNQHWSDEKIEDFLDDRLMRFKLSLLAKTPLPYSQVQEEEKWECKYCPVKARCDSLAMLENEATWRKVAGLPPVGTEADMAPEWDRIAEFGMRQIIPGIMGKGVVMPKGYPSAPPAPFGDNVKDDEVIDLKTFVPPRAKITPVPKPTPKVKTTRRKVA